VKHLTSYDLFEAIDPSIQAAQKTDIELSPSRFFDIDPADMYDFVEGLLGRRDLDVSFTEKIAGQHMTVEIDNGEIYISAKGKDRKLLKDTPYNWRITKAISEWASRNNPGNVVWRFEVIHPRHNHDFIKYKNTEVVAVEYTGRLSKVQAGEITSFGKGAVVLSKDQIVPELKQEAKDELKSWWDGGAKETFRKLRTTNKGNYYKRIVNDLRSMLIQIISKGFVSALDKVSPIEGVVGKVRQKTFKLQGKDYLTLQSVQMPFYSLVKLTKEELELALTEPQKSFEDLKLESGMDFSSVYDRNAHMSFEDTLMSYLEGNSRLADLDKDKYNRWFDPTETDKMLDDINNGTKTPKEIYYQIRRVALGK
jgi:hypothetical protein